MGQRGTSIDEKIRRRSSRRGRASSAAGNSHQDRENANDYPAKSADDVGDEFQIEDEDEDEIDDDEEDLPGLDSEGDDGIDIGGEGGDIGYIEESYFETEAGVRYDFRSFDELELSKPLLRACKQLGYTKPTPIQSAVVPLAMAGRDLSASATTGSGKTAAYALPLLERLLHRSRRHPMIHVLILTPTRELAVQVQSMVSNLAEFTDIRSALVVGGMSAAVQMSNLRSEPEIVIATPGRLIDHLHNARNFGLEDLSVLVLDEADRLLELGFKDELKELLRLCPHQRQTLLFSATMTDEVQKLAELSLTKPVRLAADPRGSVPSNLREEVVRIRRTGDAEKEPTLLALCTRTFKTGTIIFTQTKQQAHRLKMIFGLANLRAAELHGNLTQGMRLEALESFRKGDASFLIATNVAARGLDILGVESVINFDAPRTLTEYLHRVGRTARAGRSGHSVTLVEERDRSLLKLIVKRAGGKIKQRSVAAAVVAEMRAKINAMSDDIVAIHVEEREEKALRKAEMEAAKAMNMVEHEQEIFSRPKKVWFQSTTEKQRTAKEAKQVVEDTAADGKSHPRRANGGAAVKGAQKRKRTAEEEEDERMGAIVARRAKAIKSAANRIRGEGAKSRRAAKEANLDAKAARAKQKRRVAGASSSSARADDLFAARSGEDSLALIGSRGNLSNAATDVPATATRAQMKAPVKKKKSARRYKRK